MVTERDHNEGCDAAGKELVLTEATGRTYSLYAKFCAL